MDNEYPNNLNVINLPNSSIPVSNPAAFKKKIFTNVNNNIIMKHFNQLLRCIEITNVLYFKDSLSSLHTSGCSAVRLRHAAGCEYTVYNTPILSNLLSFNNELMTDFNTSFCRPCGWMVRNDKDTLVLCVSYYVMVTVSHCVCWIIQGVPEIGNTVWLC